MQIYVANIVGNIRREAKRYDMVYAVTTTMRDKCPSRCGVSRDSLYVDLLYSQSYHKRWRIVSMDIIKVFGANLRKYRTKKGLSQEQFAEICGLHRTYISDIECFQRNVSLENVQRIADALGIESYKLLQEE